MALLGLVIMSIIVKERRGEKGGIFMCHYFPLPAKSYRELKIALIIIRGPLKKKYHTWLIIKKGRCLKLSSARHFQFFNTLDSR